MPPTSPAPEPAAGPLRAGIFSWYGYVLPVGERLRLVREAGFEATTVWWEDEAAFGRERKEAVVALARAAGLHVENAHVPYEPCPDLAAEDGPRRAAAVELHRRWIDGCAAQGVPVLVMHLVPPEATGPAGAPLLDSAERLVRAAEAAGVTVALENTAGPAALDEVLRRFPSPRLGLCYDSSHDWLRGPDRAGLLGRWGARLASVHLSDNDGQEDRHWLPGLGLVDWDLVAARFPARTSSGCLTLEVYPDARRAPPAPAAFLAEARRSVEWVREKLVSARPAPGAGSSASPRSPAGGR